MLKNVMSIWNFVNTGQNMVDSLKIINFVNVK